MTIEIYRATLKYDKGKINLCIVSLNGEQGAKEQIISGEGCPESAIIKIKKLTAKAV
ncbi:hypothetical protein J7E50_18255 [Pedobacter sp. ISL-68]|uniref:hypothetical protein n=1 Tax=unclassified Pedobacter TaxID=2628915 RepID=UPI001BE58BCE|nr:MULTISPECIES: hypothetical protein [unclassified Pedobacter]MBT2559866.1 hypothetical protein [Pedobacter sp. ISL-64]MBT2592171.1 hypothetical protein [Pedobacter sp. ISL-68]